MFTQNIEIQKLLEKNDSLKLEVPLLNSQSLTCFLFHSKVLHLSFTCVKRSV